MADERNKSTHPSNEQPLVTIKRKSDPVEETASFGTDRAESRRGPEPPSPDSEGVRSLAPSASELEPVTSRTAEEFSVHRGHSGHPDSGSDSVRRSESFFPPDGMPPTIRKKRTSVVLSIVCGILAILLNLPVVTLSLGLILGVVAFGAGLAARRAHRRSAGLVLSLFSFLIAAVWLASALVPLAVDPTIRVGLLP
ncbi:DUF308 domain-containing protein [Paenibacillus sp. GbtcB18]|uniref:DUF308 domain-containing protein n=1 Tax=Paenibacillus sp. GbtcB18 TaxID=2824763 RepID=UPI0020C71AFB|nr:DUF308 domain-containing protein [Paenibacillus sp. GbtcB18]